MTARAALWSLLLGLVVAGGGAFGLVRFASRAENVASVDQLLAADTDAVIAELDLVEAQGGQTARGQFLRGLLAIRSGRWGSAVASLEAASRDPLYRPAALALEGEALHHLGQYVEAIAVLQASLELDARRTDARRWLAASLYDLGAVDLALAELMIISEQDPRDPRPHRLRGVIQQDFEQFNEAIADYRESLRRDPNQASADELRIDLAKCQLAIRDYAGAEETLQLASPSAVRDSLRARAALGSDRRADAEQLAASALAADPEDYDALLLQAEFLTDAGQHPGAAALLRRAMALRPDEFDARYRLAISLRRAGDTAEAEREMAEYQRLQTLRRKFTDLHEEAFAEIHNADLRFQLGQLSLELKRPDLAGVWFRAAVAIDPEHAEAQSALRDSAARPSSVNRASSKRSAAPEISHALAAP